ncbi:hypothetical protein ACVIVD_002607 [Bradyrhizobium liaoningense]
MRGQLCTYKAVRYDTVEGSLREHAHRLITEAPRGQNTAALQKTIDELQHRVEGADAAIWELIDVIREERGSPEATAASKRLREIEREQKETKRQLRDLTAQREQITTASVRDRLKVVERTLTGNKDPGETNRALRDAIRRIVLDPEQGRLWVRWHHSEETQDVPCYTKHMSWEEFREIKPPMHALFPERQSTDKTKD